MYMYRVCYYGNKLAMKIDLRKPLPIIICIGMRLLAVTAQCT